MVLGTEDWEPLRGLALLFICPVETTLDWDDGLNLDRMNLPDLDANQTEGDVLMRRCVSERSLRSKAEPFIKVG